MNQFDKQEKQHVFVFISFTAHITLSYIHSIAHYSFSFLIVLAYQLITFHDFKRKIPSTRTNLTRDAIDQTISKTTQS